MLGFARTSIKGGVNVNMNLTDVFNILFFYEGSIVMLMLIFFVNTNSITLHGYPLGIISLLHKKN